MTITIKPPVNSRSLLIRSQQKKEVSGEFQSWNTWLRTMLLFKGSYQIGEAHPYFGRACAKEGSTRPIRSHGFGKGARVEGIHFKAGVHGTMSNGVEFETS